MKPQKVLQEVMRRMRCTVLTHVPDYHQLPRLALLPALRQFHHRCY
jgi:hypothetical protein